MQYQKLPIGTHQPGLIVILIDQSGSMLDRYDGHTLKQDVVALVVNHCIYEIVNACKSGEIIEDRCYVGVIGYGQVTKPLLGGYPSKLHLQVKRKEILKKKIPDGAGGFIEIDTELPIWIEPEADNGTPMDKAFDLCTELVKPWIKEHPNDFPPIIVNITDGEPNNAEAAESSAEGLRSLATKDGNVLLLNAHIADSAAQEIRLPGDETGLPNPSRLLYRMSSILPKPMLDAARNVGFAPDHDARGLVINATTQTLTLLTAETLTALLFADASASPPLLDENVQFTVYRPREITPVRWYKMLIFTHLDERPEWLDANEPSPIEEVEDEAQRILGDRLESYRKTTEESRLAVPRENEITMVPEMQGIEFNPRTRSFLWKEGLSVHLETFELRAGADFKALAMARGRLTVFLGHLILAEVGLSIRVSQSRVAGALTRGPSEWSSARRFRRIFASYSHKDLEIVKEMERYSLSLGDRYLRDSVDLRAGERWNERLLGMITEADIFQLFWSWNSSQSPYVEREWRHALSLSRETFIRPTYWQDPWPHPPEPLRLFHFVRLPEPRREEKERPEAERRQTEARVRLEAERRQREEKQRFPSGKIASSPGKRKLRPVAGIMTVLTLVICLGSVIYFGSLRPSPPAAPSSWAINNLGELYEHGQGVAQDYGKAREWYQKAADAGNRTAMRNLGVLYDKGQGVPQDYGKAHEWYQKAADAGDRTAMNNLGVLYEYGHGVAQDYGKAREWYQKAADAGDGTAMNNLGELYRDGIGVAQDYGKAREWYQKAADAGNADAMFKLGWLYEKGLGVAKDYDKAREWYQKGADAGNIPAIGALARFRSK
jgi:uncharacterized protein YegL